MWRFLAPNSYPWLCWTVSSEALVIQFQVMWSSPLLLKGLSQELEKSSSHQLRLEFLKVIVTHKIYLFLLTYNFRYPAVNIQHRIFPASLLISPPPPLSLFKQTYIPGWGRSCRTESLLKLQQILDNALWEFYTYPFPNPLEMVRLGPVEAKPVTGPAGRVASHRMPS
jgi:hypothetical protein